MRFCFRQRILPEGNAAIPVDVEDDFEIPVKHRVSTNMKSFNFLITLLTFVTLSIIVAYIRGDVLRFFHGHDDYGNLCGMKNDPITDVNGSGADYTHRKFLHIKHFIESGNCVTERTCVDKCRHGYDYSIIPKCYPGESDNPGSPFHSTFPFFERICFEISICWKEIFTLLFISLCLSVLPIALLHYMAKTVIWSILIFATLASLMVTIYSWVVWSQRRQKLVHYTHLNMVQSELNISFISAILLTIFTAIYLLILMNIWNKVKLAIVLFEEATKCVAAMPAMLLLPCLSYTLIIVVCWYVILGFIGFQISEPPNIDTQGKVTFSVNGFFMIMRWPLLFVAIWVSQFLLACQNLIISGSVATWYFKKNRKNLQRPVWKSFKLFTKYHLGSAAKRCVFLAMVKPIREICKIFKHSADENKVMNKLWSTVRCILSFDHLIKGLCKDGYVMIMIHGQHFCDSTRLALESIEKSPASVRAVDGVGPFILHVMELILSMGVTIMAIVVFENVIELQSIWIPTSLVFILTYFCSHCFLSVYEMAVRSLLLCFCEDMRINDGLDRPYFLSTGFSVFFHDSGQNSIEIASNFNSSSRESEIPSVVLTLPNEEADPSREILPTSLRT